MDEYVRAEEKARSRCKLISEEFAESEAEKAKLTALSESQSKQIGELRMRLHELRITLRNVEEEEAATTLDNDLSVDKRVRDNEYLVREWREKLHDSEIALGQVTPEWELKKQKLTNRLQEEKQRIQDKISQVLNKKDCAIDDLRDRLGDLRAQNDKLQELVDERRKRQLAIS
jgi:hypothetical protein